MTTPINIRFPLVKERTGNRRGPRFRLVPDKAGLYGARVCVAGMIAIAIRQRDHSKTPVAIINADLDRRIERVKMRQSALWARIFAGQVDNDDPRLVAAGEEHTRLVTAYSVRGFRQSLRVENGTAAA